MNRLNQDSVEYLFSVIRAKGGIRDHHISFSQLIDKQLLIQF